jgi:hypothetical protein
VPAALVLAAVLAQAQVPATGDRNLERIRKALAEPAPIATSLETKEGPVFRVLIRAPRPPRPLWDTDTMIPSYVRPSMPGLHYDFLAQVTDPVFKAGVLYPGMSLGPLLKWLGGNKSKEDVRREKEAKARKEVVRDLEAFLKAQQPIIVK